jgi:hypothetical protein
MIARGLVVLSVLLFASAFFGGRRSPRTRTYAVRVAILALSLSVAAAYVWFGARWYESLGVRGVGKHESEYFASQTLTTVGYGGALAMLRDDVPRDVLDSFHLGSSIAMLVGSVVWGFVLAAIANVFLTPAPTSSATRDRGNPYSN